MAIQTVVKREIELRNGSKIEASAILKGESEKTPPPHPTDPPQREFSLFLGAVPTFMEFSVECGCEFFNKLDGCEDRANIHVRAKWTGGDVDYLMCDSCYQQLDWARVPFSNTGQDFSRGVQK